jgi:hypothetical protein
MKYCDPGWELIKALTSARSRLNLWRERAIDG